MLKYYKLTLEDFEKVYPKQYTYDADWHHKRDGERVMEMTRQLILYCMKDHSEAKEGEVVDYIDFCVNDIFRHLRWVIIEDTRNAVASEGGFGISNLCLSSSNSENYMNNVIIDLITLAGAVKTPDYFEENEKFYDKEKAIREVLDIEDTLRDYIDVEMGEKFHKFEEREEIYSGGFGYGYEEGLASEDTVNIPLEPQELKPLPQDGNEHESVDLGLPSGKLWAKCNVGATTETEYGDYFMWGSVTPNTNDKCDWVNAPFNNGSSSFVQNYFNTVKDTVCPNGVLAPEYDAVHQIMGGDWRMPTKEDFDELLEGTTNEWVEGYQDSGINGRLFTSKANGNTMFIPASGGRWGTSFSGVGYGADVWSSALFAEREYNAWGLDFYSDYCGLDYYGCRCGGSSIRGVKEP